MLFFYDLPNFIGVLVLIVASFRLGLIPLWLGFVLGVLAFAPFLLNDFLFPASYMPDQFKYLSIVQGLRGGEYDYEEQSRTVELAGWFLALVPLPLIETVTSLGFYNRFIATLLIVWLYSKKHIRGWPLLFVLFYPSFILYSSLALRDTLVVLFMLLSLIFFIDNRRLLAIFISLPLVWIKFQCFGFLVVFFLLHLSFTKGNFFFKFRFVLLPVVLALIAPFVTTIIGMINFYRRAMFLEDDRDVGLYFDIDTVGGFVVAAVESAPYFLLKPFPWEVGNLLQLVQSLENLLLVFFLFYIFMKSFCVDKLLAFKWLLFLVISLSIYGLVVFNYGTAARYRFPLILVSVLGMAYELYIRYRVIIGRN